MTTKPDFFEQKIKHTTNQIITIKKHKQKTAFFKLQKFC